MRMTSKGQVTIPIELRKRFGLEPESEVVFEAGEEGVIVRPARPASERIEKWIRTARGISTTGRSTDQILQTTRGED